MPPPPLSPQRTILQTFLLHKTLLLLITLGSTLASEPYDTSAGLALALQHPRRSDALLLSNRDAAGGGGGGGLGRRLVARLTSWDAVYFVGVARRGYRFEQEWAFGGGLPVVVVGVVDCEFTFLLFLGWLISWVC